MKNRIKKGFRKGESQKLADDDPEDEKTTRESEKHWKDRKSMKNNMKKKLKKKKKKQLCLLHLLPFSMTFHLVSVAYLRSIYGSVCKRKKTKKKKKEHFADEGT